MHRLLGEMAATNEHDSLLGRFSFYSGCARALRMDNGLSFCAGLRRLLGQEFFRKVRASRPCEQTQMTLKVVCRRMFKARGFGRHRQFFLVLVRRGRSIHTFLLKLFGCEIHDVAGMIPISESILEHHITKFKAGGTVVTESDEAECRAARHILTLGPAAILGARRIVQSIVDASTAPAKRESYRQVLTTQLSNDGLKRQSQLDQNPGLWLRSSHSVLNTAGRFGEVFCIQ